MPPIRLHKGISAALTHPSVWAGVAGVLSSTGTELDKPYSTICFVTSALCSLIAIFIRTPGEGDGPETQSFAKENDV